MTLSLSYARPFAALVLVLFLSGAGSIVAQESFRATHVAQLAADEETQAVADDSANGIGIFRVDRAAGTLEYRVSVAGLTGIIGAHIHRGAFGEDGPVVVPLAITDAMHTASGIATGLSAGFLDSLLAGQAYVNVHTSEHQPGHIRGQIIELPNALVPVMTTVGEPHDVTGDSGIGAVAMFIDEATRTMRYSLEWERLTGPATSAHFHLAAPGQAGPPVHPITLPGDPSVMNTSGVWQMSPEHLDALKNGLIYVNIHTAVNPMGEIRGQVLPADLYTAAVNAANEVPSCSSRRSSITRPGR
jgi:hypothetical protein